MLRLFAVSLLLCAAATTLQIPSRAADNNALTADSKAQDGVPKGEVLKFTFDKSRIFPGTTREYWIYIPRQYDPTKPACVYVNQDGIQWQAPRVFDNLIAKQEMPVTIGVFVMHGRVPAPDDKALDRFNRSYEYDGLGGNYARFILEEILPDVERKTASDGRALHLSKSGNDRAIGGSSSGAIAAFTAAWERPAAFSRVWSAIGTYVGLRGGNDYPTLIRKTEPKPIRVFLQDGSNDLNIYGGDWWMANQEMERALQFAGYEVNHVWGEGGHSGDQGTAIFPDVMRWLWKDWPKPVAAGSGSSQLRDILMAGEDWQVAARNDGINGNLTVNAQGEVLMQAPLSQRTFKIGVGEKAVPFAMNSQNDGAQSFGPDDRLYASGKDGILVIDTAGKKRTWVKKLRAKSLIARADGSLYLVERNPIGADYIAQRTATGAELNRMWFVSPQGNPKRVGDEPILIGGITLSPDQTLLYVNDTRSHWVYSYQIQPDGSLQHGQKYFHLHVPGDADDSGAGGMTVDSNGRLYVATRMGIQVCDQPGRVNCIIPVPGAGILDDNELQASFASDVKIGGANFDTLFVTVGAKVLQRKIKPKAALSFLPPVKPNAPGL